MSSAAARTDTGGLDDADVTGRVFDIQRFSIHDGPGIRTTVFLKGCPLRCPWCHNPESISGAPVISIDRRRCLGCRACLGVCPHDAIGWEDAFPVIDRDRCRVCGACAAVCPSTAIERIGEDHTVDAVMDIVDRDRSFYAESGGGLTLSGGEPALQPEFSCALLGAGRARGIHTAVETSGCGSKGVFEAFADLCDLFILDIKAEPGAYSELVGAPFDAVERTLTMLHESRRRIWLRFPLVKGVNDGLGRLEHIVSLAERFPRVERFELVPFHGLWTEKLARFGMAPSSLGAQNTPDEEQVEQWSERLRERGVRMT